ncbi:ATP-grasp domain-containing protein [Murinocardiopsis flavida]|uniref:ATP-grasp domain-containing protein n=1 Tax=Murinocardiopsis flavida TaxID=645275 RepID=A0A2P8DHL5_9ACTN|nr:ATP-grasp domain-containing protein [Murinocardiopsis flavida]PSK96706.1 ATP-grasp domain-containing protein [Murinocardiopsis flavida]
MSENVFILGLDEHNRETLESIPHLRDYRFHPLLDVQDMQDRAELDMTALLDRARAQLDAFPGSVDAIIGYWDFPVSSMVPILCAERGLPAAPLESVVACEHKYWSRLAQQEVIDEYPRFAEVDFDTTAKPPGLSYPLWLKPVKAFSSELAFRVTDDAGFRDALARIKDGAGRIGEPFEFVMDRVALPDRVAAAGGTACLAEEEAKGDQVTLEGYVHAGEVYVYGVIDAECYPDTSSFLRYRYPTRQPADVVERLTGITRRVIKRLGLNWVTFNVEFFVDAERGTVVLLEINPRHSQSHAKLFEYVEGLPNHECVVRLALGREPELMQSKGAYQVAAKWFLRRFEDGVVRRAPSADDVARLEEAVPGSTVKLIAGQGDRLSDLPAQDSYSYELAQIFVGADDEAGLTEKYRTCAESLDFEIADTEEAVGP